MAVVLKNLRSLDLSSCQLGLFTLYVQYDLYHILPFESKVATAQGTEVYAICEQKYSCQFCWVCMDGSVHEHLVCSVETMIQKYQIGNI